MHKVYLSTNFTKLNEKYGLPDCFTDYQIRHLGNPSGLPEILLKIDPCEEIKFTPDNILITKQTHTVISCEKNMLRLNAQLCREYNLHNVKLNRRRKIN